ncbi:MAG: CerR family C-terminal domain-containing protein [Phycisphaerales bacterium]
MAPPTHNPLVPDAGDAGTRLRLIEAAGPVFARAGFADATVREIVAAAGANVAAVNYHFGDKMGLYKAVLQHYTRASIAAHPVTPPGFEKADAETRLRAFVGAFVNRLFDEGKPAWMSQMITREMTAPTEAFHDLVQSHMRPQIDTLRRIIHELTGLPEGDVRVQRCAASVIAQCVNYKLCAAAHKVLSPLQTYDPPGKAALAAHITAFSLAGIAAIRDESASPSIRTPGSTRP